MSDEPQNPKSKIQNTDVSAAIIRLARAIERACRTPGRYTITLTIPDHPRAAWSAEITRVEPLQQLQLEKKPPPDQSP